MSVRRIPSLNWLRVFEVAAREESFARAARALNMSAPAVSQQVRALESHLGSALFRRRAQRVELTDEGRAFLPVVHQALASVETTAAALFGPDDQQTITVQAISLLAMGWLPQQIARFEEAHPGYRINLITGNIAADFQTVLPGREPDLQINFGSPSDFPDNAEALFGETLSIVANDEVAQQMAGVADLQRYRLLEVTTHRSGWHQMLATWPEVDLRQMTVMMVDSTPFSLMMAANGLGLALARSPASDLMVRALNLRRIPFSPQVAGLQGYFIVMPSGVRGRNRGVAKLRNWLLEAGQRAETNASDQVD